MRNYLLLLSLLCTGIACKDKEPEPGITFYKAKKAYCGVGDPLNELTWLKAKVDTFSSVRVGNYTVAVVEYKNSEYFIAGSAFSSSPASEIFTCSGQQALKPLGVTYNQFMEAAKTVQTLYTRR